ncbi:unnamed protein product [Linum trigynum]|uniref:Senescence-associated carboxylesterase 101 n=1 Tax=Linum trigynum TaxID=586398 RepID=A0AAV2F141_9ROSI
MNHQPPIFNSGVELASSVVDSELLDQSWSSICNLYTEVNSHPHQQSPPATFKIFKQHNLTIIAFVTSPIYTPQHLQQQGGQDLMTSATLKAQNFPHLDFLCSRGNPSFSIHSDAVSSFVRLFNDIKASPHQFLVSRDDEIVLESPLIVTGHALGGSIASLFTLWLLDGMSQLPSKKPSKKLPLCITFGSPLIGDSGLHRGISQRSTWKSSFLHVVSSHDFLPRLLMTASNYKPFGTFMLCSEMDSTCVEDPDVVSMLFLKGIELAHLGSGEGLPVEHYGLMVEHLKRRDLCEGSSDLGWPVADSLQAGIILLLDSIGIARNQHQHPSVTDLASQLYRKERLSVLSKRNAMDPSRKLNDIKIKMAFLEWYKKDCKNKGVGYYDSYKNQRATSDMDIAKHKKYLTNYWKEMVEEAESHPQKEGAYVRMTWLYAGNTYRKMVEPLDIAEYYRKTENRDYMKVKQGRSKHYILLEKWWKEDCESHHPMDLLSKKRNVDGNFTEDSCFWAHVEEARFSCGLIKDFGRFGGGNEEEKRLSEGYLLWFERYVMEQIGNYALNPEVFVAGSSFMKWWAEFHGILGSGHRSELAEFMRKGTFRKYGSDTVTNTPHRDELMFNMTPGNFDGKNVSMFGSC